MVAPRTTLPGMASVPRLPRSQAIHSRSPVLLVPQLAASVAWVTWMKGLSTRMTASRLAASVAILVPSRLAAVVGS